MRTAGKRPKALPARRIRPRDSRFVPTLTDRPQPAPWTAPSASLSASTHAACGDFQEPLSARPDRCLCKKIFFSRSAGCPVATRFSPVFFPARTAHPSVTCCLHSFPLCQSRRRQPLRTVLPPAFPPLIKGWICPHSIQATVFLHTKNFSQWQACPNLSSAAPVPSPIPHGIPTDDHAAHGRPTLPGRPPQPSIVRGKLQETHAPGASAARTLPSH